MTSTSFKRAAYGLLGLSLAFVFLSVPRTSSSTAAAMGAATPPTAPVVLIPGQPTPAQRYNCDDPEHPDYITFNWTGTRPHGGFVGEVTYGGVKTLVQAFDAKVDTRNPQITDWAFQAQNGSFVCRMIVDSRPRQGNVAFGSCRNNNWPLLFCSLRGN